jgi:hypothetical protein
MRQLGVKPAAESKPPMPSIDELFAVNEAGAE